MADLLFAQAISYPLPLNTDQKSLYGSTFTHLAILLTRVDELPKPQLLGKSNFVVISPPKISQKNKLFNFLADLRIDIKVSDFCESVVVIHLKSVFFNLHSNHILFTEL